MGTLDPTPHDNTRRVSKIIDIQNKTNPQVKQALDEWLGKGWRLVSIYKDGTEIRAIFIKDM